MENEQSGQPEIQMENMKHINQSSFESPEIIYIPVSNSVTTDTPVYIVMMSIV